MSSIARRGSQRISGCLSCVVSRAIAHVPANLILTSADNCRGFVSSTQIVNGQASKEVPGICDNIQEFMLKRSIPPESGIELTWDPPRSTGRARSHVSGRRANRFAMLKTSIWARALAWVITPVAWLAAMNFPLLQRRRAVISLARSQTIRRPLTQNACQSGNKTSKENVMVGNSYLPSS